MRVEFINKHTGNAMFVDESRVAEYEALGHSKASIVIADVVATEIKPDMAVKKETKRSKRNKE